MTKNNSEKKELIIRKKKYKGDDGFKVFSIRIKDETVTKLDEIAAETGRSRNELINTFLDFTIDNCRVEE